MANSQKCPDLSVPYTFVKLFRLRIPVWFGPEESVGRGVGGSGCS